MKNLKNFGVQELNAKEIKETDGGWLIPVSRAIAKAATVLVAINDLCDQCITNRIAESDSSLGGSRPFE